MTMKQETQAIQNQTKLIRKMTEEIKSLPPMERAKHTPGPWQFYADLPSTEPDWHIVTNASRMRVLANVHIEPGNDMDLANARLIAAAPELLEAIRGILRSAGYESGEAEPTLTSLRVNIPYLDAARRAIAKAEGRV